MSWLKFDTSTPEKPEVFAITVAMGWEDPDLTVGKLLKVWRWFDSHSSDGNAGGVTLALLDRVIGVTGLSQALVNVGWLIVTDTGLQLPNFEKHNGKTAKDRALTAKRVAEHKTNAKGNAPTVTNALPREEKRREEKKEPKGSKNTSAKALACPPDVDESVWSDFLQLRKTKRAPLTQTALDGIAKQAGKAGITLTDALAVCCKRGWVGFEADWLLRDKRSSPMSEESPWDRAQRERMAEFAPGVAARAPARTGTIIDITPGVQNGFAIAVG